MPGPTQPVLSVVIPALNEEGAIGDTLRRCLDARARIADAAGLAGVELLVVSDGSSDRTEQIALAFPEVTVLAFERNRGYGAAIKTGWEHARGDLLGFLDADGTCDPDVFASLCRVAQGGADVVLGSRMGKDSRMPAIRVVGNKLFAWMLGLLSHRVVQDTASGMRVVRRAALSDLYPLPDGLHFTPAMSARALLEDKLSLVEVPMPYADRVGRSKLSVVRDGFRFLDVIVRAAAAFHPARLLLLAAGALGLVALLVGALPVVFYARHLRLEEWMIYRVLLCSLLGTAAFGLTCTAVVAERIASVAFMQPPAARGVTATLTRVVRSARAVRWVAVGLATLSIVVTWPGLEQYAATGHVDMHWSRAVLASLLVTLGAMLPTSTLLLGLMDLISAQRDGRSGVRPPDRLRVGTALTS
jgi:glycosyltransferase involved in cell wall biosynthesis